MTRIEKIIVLFFLSFFVFSGIALAVPSPADTTLDSLTLEMCRKAPVSSDYPDARDITLYAEKKISLREDGGYTIEWRNVSRILTFSGKKDLSNIKYKFDADYEKMDISRARSITLNKDSTFSVSVAESLQINDITPPGLSDAGIYSALKQRVITIPGVVDSSVVDIGGSIRTFAKPKKPFEGIEFLASESPVLYRKLVIEVPKGEKLIYLSANGAPQPIIEGNRYTWILKNYAGVVPEPSGPAAHDRFPCVFYTITKSWTLAGDYIQARFSPAITPTEEITAKANQIAGELIGKPAIDTLASWVANNIRMIDIPLGDAGYIPNDAGTVLKNGYADTRDRAVILASLLRARGFDPSIALLPPVNANVRESVPSLAQFTRVAVVLPGTDGGKIWLWTEDDYTLVDRLPGYDGEKALIVSPGKGELISTPEIPTDKNGIELNFDLELNASGDISGRMLAIFRGDLERNIRRSFRDASPKKKKQGVESIASEIGGGKLQSEKSFEFENLDNLSMRPTLSMDFISDNFAFIQDDMMIFNFPDNPFDFARGEISTSLDERKEPLVIRTKQSQNYSYKVKIPQGYKVVWVSETKNISNSFGEMHISSAVSEDIVTFNVWLLIKDTWVDPNEYKLACDLMRSYNAPKNRMILLEKIRDLELENKGKE